MSRSIVKLGLAGFLIMGSTAAFAGALVVRAAGPSATNYPPGKMLPDSSKVALRNGDTLTLLNATSAQTLHGPGVFPVSSKDEVLADAATRRTRFWAVRRGEIPENPSPWNLDVTQSGKVCVADPAKLVLWRPQSDQPSRLEINGGGHDQILDWPAGKATLAWPATLKITDGAAYRLQQDGNGDSADVTFVTVASAPTALQPAAKVLIDNGCENQLETLLAKAGG